MKTRRWIIVIALFFGFSVLVLYHGWNLIQANDKIKNYLVASLKPVLGEKFSIKSLDVSIGAIHLKGVELFFEDQYYQLQIEDVRFGFNFFNLIKSGFRPQKIPQDVIFVKPHLITHAIKKKDVPAALIDSTLLDFDTNKYFKKMEDFGFIKRITISRGKISYIDSSKKTILLGNDINGWLSTTDLEHATARLVGKVFKSKNFNLSMSGKINLNQGKLDTLNVKLKNYKLKREDAFFLPEYYDIRAGIVDGAILLKQRKDNLPGFEIGGHVSVRDGIVRLLDKNLFFEKINIDADVEDWNLKVKNASTVFNGSQVNITGKINNMLDPRLALTLESSSFDARAFINNISPGAKTWISGTSSFNFEVTNTFEKPEISGELESPSLTFNDFYFKNTRIKLSYSDSLLRVESVQTKLPGLTLLSSSEIDFAKNRQNVKYSVDVAGNLFEKYIPVPIKTLKNSQTYLRISGTGRFDLIKGDIDLVVKNQSNTDTTFLFSGDLRFLNEKLHLNINALSHHFQSKSEFDFSKKKKKHFTLSGLHNLIKELPEFKNYEKYFSLKDSRIQIDLEKNKMTVSSFLDWNRESELTRTADLNFTVNLKNKQRRIRGGMNVFSGDKDFKFNFDLNQQEEIIEFKKLNIDGMLLTEGTLQLGKNKSIQANVIFPNAPLQDMAKLLYRSPEAVQEGELYGTVGLMGSLDNLEITGELELSDVVLNSIGNYDGKISFELLDKIFSIEEFQVKKNKEIIFQTIGSYGLKTNEIDFDIHSDNVDMSSLFVSFFNEPGLLSGTSSADLRFHGTIDEPCLCGKITVRDGKLSKFSFDSMTLELDENYPFISQDSAAVGDTLGNAGLRMKQIQIVRNNQFKIQGKGFIPFSKEKEMDIEMSGDGNILSILPELTTFFKETRSSGNWFVRMRGSPGNVSVSDCQVDLTDGYLRLANVAPEIKNIELSINLEDDGFLNIEFLSGKIRRKPFTFRNQPGIGVSSSNNLEPFLIPNLGLNLGVFSLETSTKGIPLHIPGLMEKKEFGNMIFRGKNNDEEFYFSGPVEKPHLRGTLELQNADITFPFIVNKNKKKTRKSEIIIEILKSIEWDVRTVVGKDAHYKRQIPSGLDNVYVDLILDAGVGGLNFNGVLAENTFGVTGLLESSRGNVEYLNLNFQVVKVGAEFDMEANGESEVSFDKRTLLPIIYGEARTTVTDSTGFPYYIYLTMLTKDRETGQAQKRGRLGDVMFQLSSENSQLGDSEGDILASLGYSASNLKGMAADLIGISADNMVFRPLFRPFERQLEQRLGLDMVRFSSRFTRNLIEMNVNEERNYMFDSKLFLLRSTKVMVGKYLADQLFLMYSGQLEAGMDYRYQHEGFGLSHKFGLEYRINPSLLLQMEYDYNSLLLMKREDKRVLLRHSFPF